MRLKGAGIQVSKYSNPATLAAFLVEFMSLPCLSKALWGLSILRLSRHALQRFRRMLQGGVELERRLVGLLRLRLSPFLLVNRAEVVVRVGERRLVLRRRVGDVLLRRLLAARKVRVRQRGSTPEVVEGGHVAWIELQRRFELRKRVGVVLLSIREVLSEVGVRLR